MRPIETKDLPDRLDVEGKRPWENLCGGAYFYLDEHDRAVLATTDRRILAIATSDADGDPDLTVDATYDVSDVVPEDDCLIALMPDWDGHIWFETSGRAGRDGRPGHRARRRCSTSDEEIANSFAVDEQGVYVVTVEALYRLSADADRQAAGRLAHASTTAAPSRSPASSAAAAAPRRRCCPTGWSRSPTTPTRG